MAVVIWRPRGLNIAIPVVIGAVFAIAFGLVSANDLLFIFEATWDAALTLIALMIISASLDSNGFFNWGARRLLIKARGSSRRAFFFVVALTVLVAAVLTNDGAVLILVPIFCKMFGELGFEEKEILPYLFAAGFLADAASTPLVASNLTNIIIADAFRLDPAHFAATMLLPTLIIAASASLILLLQFRNRLPDHYDPAQVPPPGAAVRDWQAFKIGWAVLGLLPVACLFCGLLKIPVSLIAGVSALILLLHGKVRSVLNEAKIIKEAPWYILIYAGGMFVIMVGLHNSGLTGPILRLLNPASSSTAIHVFGAGSISGIVSAVVNNLPASLIGILALKGGALASAPAVSNPAVYALVIGVDVGPKLTPIGSLATLLWLDLLAKSGIKVKWVQYLKESWLVTIVVLLLALAGLLVVTVL